jgi:DNA helicase II / ATP-dependent DNA helicase PcrA
MEKTKNMPETIIDNLNKAQLEAVTHTKGPLLVVAGAGTGKTRVITAKILHLLTVEKVPSSSLLALTFTEKATEEMRARVDEALPFGYEEIAIMTFHGFCDKVLKESGHEIGIDPGFKLLDQSGQWLFLRKRIMEMGLDYYRPLGNPGKFVGVLLEHFSRLKDEDISPEEYLVFAQKKGTEAKDEAEIESAKKMLEAANAYSKYQEQMLQENQLDFGDLIHYTLKLFKERPSVLKEYSDRYTQIMVDEFQDTNFAQNRIVNLLAQKHRNITVVGDDDQSIYKWRGASLSNIMTFREAFPEAKACVLNNNYRSSQNILDFSHALIKNNDPFRLEASENLSKRLMAHKGEGTPIEVRHFDDYLKEAENIAEEIKKSVEEGNLSYADNAILVRTNSIAGIFAESLKTAGIPYSMRDSRGLFRFEEIKDMIALVKFIVKPQDDVSYFRLLSLPVFGLPMGLLLDLTRKAKAADYEPLFFYLMKAAVKKSGATGTLPGMEEFDETTGAAAGINKIFESLLDFSRAHSANRIIGEFLDKSGYYRSLTEEMTQENNEKVQHIAQFLEIAARFEEPGRHGLTQFLEFIDALDEIQVPIQARTTADSDAVSILTVHSAKGLEFEQVFVPSLVAQRFPATNRKDPISIPAELIKEPLPHEDMHMHEERRLFYVACTRAKSKLILSYSDFYEGAKKWKPSPFLAEIDRAGLAVVKSDFTVKDKSAEDTGRKPAGFAATTVKTEAAAKLAHVPEINVNNLSFSRVDTFETCPLKYKFKYLFQIASPTPHAANFGSSVHNAVNRFHESVTSGAEPTLELLKDCYEKTWIPVGYESKAHEQARKKKGLDVMETFYENEKRNGFIVPAFLEKAFNVKIGKVRFNGRIDRIDKLPDGTYEVIDFKTGSYKKGVNLKNDLQLSLYALACRDVFNIKVSALSLYFLENAEKVSTTRAPEDLDKLKTELLEVSANIKVSDFAPTPGHHCDWCEYRILCNAAQ